MVTITNGVKTFRVTAGSIKPYKNMGFYVVSDENDIDEEEHMEHKHYNDDGMSVDTEKRMAERVSIKEEANDREAVYLEELLEKPISQWSNEEVKEFVRIKGIDTSGAQKVSQVRGIIKTYIEEQSRNM